MLEWGRTPKAEAVCRHCVQNLTAKTINIWEFCTLYLLIIPSVCFNLGRARRYLGGAAEASDRWLWRERLWGKESVKTRVENAMRNVNNRSRIRAWWWRRAGWRWCTRLIMNTKSRLIVHAALPPCTTMFVFLYSLVLNSVITQPSKAVYSVGLLVVCSYDRCLSLVNVWHFQSYQISALSKSCYSHMRQLRCIQNS